MNGLLCKRVEHREADLSSPEDPEASGFGLGPTSELAALSPGALTRGPHVPRKAQGDCTAGAAAAAAGTGAASAPGEAGEGTAAPADPGNQEAPRRGCVCLG